MTLGPTRAVRQPALAVLLETFVPAAIAVVLAWRTCAIRVVLLVAAERCAATALIGIARHTCPVARAVQRAALALAAAAARSWTQSNALCLAWTLEVLSRRTLVGGQWLQHSAEQAVQVGRGAH